MISFAIGIFGIIKLNILPSDKYTLNGTLWRIVIFSSISSLYDFIMIILVAFFLMPHGEYSADFGILTMLIILIVYAPACIITSFRLKKRMKKIEGSKYNINRINALNCSIFFKALFFFFGTIWFLEGV